MKYYFYSMVAIVLLMLCGISISEASEQQYKYTVQCYFPNKVETFKTNDIFNSSIGYYVLKQPKIIVKGQYIPTSKEVRVPVNSCITYGD